MAREKKNIVENTYDSNSIQVLEGLEAVRKRPGMYIGSTDSRGLHHLVWEIVDNAVDEALAGYGDEIVVSIEEGNGIRVRDFGRGMPVGMHSMGISTPEVIFTILHAGGKFGQGGYKSSGGLHGVGSSVVNALSSELVVTIWKDGKVHQAKFCDGGKIKESLKVIDNYSDSNLQGTEVFFQPDKTMFSALVYNYDTLAERLRETAFLMKGLKVTLIDNRKGKNKEESFKYDNGIQEFVEYLNGKNKVLHSVQLFEGVSPDGIEIEFAFQYNNSYSENVISFVNNVRTKDGGTHETGAKTALTRIFNDFARNKGLLKEKDKNLEGADVREGLTAIVSVRVPENLLQFEGQTKGKLGTSEARSAVDSILSEKLGFYFNESSDVAQLLIGKAIKSAKVREEARKARDAARNGGKKKKEVILSGKLTPAQSKNPDKNELYLVEGDSAGGCHTADTLIKLADGRSIRFDNLLKEFESGKVNYVLSYNIEKDLHEVLPIDDVFITKRNAKVIELVFDDGSTVKCTPDHPYLLRSGEYKDAKDLLPSDSLRTVYLREQHKGYLRFNSINSIQGNMLFHRWVYEQYFGPIPEGYVVHHDDENKQNNNPENLLLMEQSTHSSYHASAQMNLPEFKNNLKEIHANKMKTDEKYRADVTKRLTDYWKTDEAKEKQSKKVTQYFKDNPDARDKLSNKAKEQWSNEELRKWRDEQTRIQMSDPENVLRKIESERKTKLEKSLLFMKDLETKGLEISKEVYEDYRKIYYQENKKRMLKWSTLVEYAESEENLFEMLNTFNHRVVEIRRVDELYDVYDLTVGPHHNFALSNGVYVHNSAKQGRDRVYQAILPLRGKVVNTEKAKLADIMKNEEIATIINTIGAGVGSEFEVEDSNYDKVIIMTDADNDGSHIQVLLLTFFYKFMRPMIEAGKIYIALPPLYKISKGSGKSEVIEYAWSDEDLVEAQNKIGNGYNLQRYKGLGEMNAEQLWETTMNPDTRTLIQVTIDDALEAENTLKVLMGDKVEPRRNWIESNVQFDLE